ncbi:HEPN domain-containing protein [Legionella bononiensis]|uniref:Apea-like HEPN domain-containing protein n=1 Tax=Legionella bononiensis TaxID=2793102 RepID=A0ABS1WAR0_9GAMM|nr:HEPN domain-containing protein [Legionella bononiensis]MBL7480320.1 hypothetical protein [Legionella bononiensis]MBL7526448.1 hypothetical protein [Legionella bononiensis]MBL7563058.1 hypothetical protein [Legionella bononiensis]
MRILKKIKHKGLFWLPMNENKFEGNLIITDGGRIKLLMEKPLGNSEDNFDVIHGLIDNRPVSLINSYYRRYPFLYPLDKQFEIHVHEALYGKHYLNADKINLIEGTFRFISLYKWFNKKITTSIKINDDTLLTLKVNKNNTSFVLTSSIPFTQEEFYKKIKIVEYFFILILNHIVNLKKISMVDENKCKVLVYHQSTIFDKNKDFQSSEFLEFYDFENFLLILKNFIDLYETHYPIFYLYLSYLSEQYHVLETKFLALAQSLEAFHRIDLEKKNHTYMDPVQFKTLKTHILDWCAIEENNIHQEWLNDVISHMNDITFKQRLNQLIEPFKVYLKDNEECDNLITRIVRTRNNLTHIDAKNIKKSHENNLLELCFKMDVLLCFLIFSKLGFSSDEFQKIFQSEAIKFKLNLK